MSGHRRATRRTKAAAPPPVAAPPMIRNTELIGLDEDGNMSLWQRGNVQPVTEFERVGPWIQGGHYVIQWRGHAITVHCNGPAFGTISVQFMCSRNWVARLPHLEVEAMLLGKVVDDPEETARTVALIKEAMEALHERQRAPIGAGGRSNAPASMEGL
jgi:hypothetical protein